MIRAEKQRLIKEGKIKKNKTDSVIYKGEDNRHYENLPNGWAVCKIADIVNLRTGATFDKASLLPYDNLGGIRVLRGGNISQHRIAFKNDDIFIPNENVSDAIRVQQYDIITPAVTSLENIGKMALISSKPSTNLTIGGFIYLLTPFLYSEILSKFLLYQLTSNWFIKQLKFITKKSGSAFYNINKNKFNDLSIYLPSLSEQGRIIASIETLFAQIDIIDKNQTDIEKLYDALKKRTLDLAIQGKLVPQDKNDEPASELLKRIRAEKKAKLGKKYVDSYIYKGDDNCYYEHIDGKNIDKGIEVPFDLPENWVWSRIQTISDSYIGLTYKPSDIVHENGSIVLRSSNIQNGKLDLTDLIHVNSSITEKLRVKKNDIIICARNGSKKLVGKSAIVDIDLPNLTFGAFMAICKTTLYKYVYIFLQSNLFFAQLAGVSGTTTINQLTQAHFNSFFVPIPPLAEQKGIVAKIDEIFAKL